MPELLKRQLIHWIELCPPRLRGTRPQLLPDFLCFLSECRPCSAGWHYSSCCSGHFAVLWPEQSKLLLFAGPCYGNTDVQSSFWGTVTPVTTSHVGSSPTPKSISFDNEPQDQKRTMPNQQKACPKDSCIQEIICNILKQSVCSQSGLHNYPKKTAHQNTTNREKNNGAIITELLLTKSNNESFGNKVSRELRAFCDSS